MYFVDFAKHVFKKGNVPIIIYLVINIWIIALLFNNLFKANWLQAFVIGMLFYMISLSITLSPIGEAILRLQTGCKKIKRKDYADFINPIFEKVYMEASLKDPSIAKDIQIFMSDDECANAFATGRKTICVTKGMLNESEDCIKAVIAHELGHLANRDTDLILVISVGNFIITTLFVTIRMIARLFVFIGNLVGIIGGEIAANIGVMLSGLLVDIILVILMKVWTKIGMLLVMKSSRNHEFEADLFSAELGYGVPLCAFLDEYSGNGFNGLFASLVSSHPESDHRIAYLQEHGVPYYLQRN